MGYEYTWNDSDPKCHSQPAFLKQGGYGSTPAAAIDSYHFMVNEARQKEAPEPSIPQDSIAEATSSAEPESEAMFVFKFVNAMGAVTSVDHDTLKTVGRQEYVRCTQSGYTTSDQLDDCILNHADGQLMALSSR